VPVSAAFALALGYMLGLRGHALFDSLFARVLDRDENALTFLVMDAKRLGLLDIKAVADDGCPSTPSSPKRRKG